MHCYQLEQTCSTSLLEVVERIRCSADFLQEVVVRVVGVVDRVSRGTRLRYRVVVLVEEAVVHVEEVVAQLQELVDRSTE
jgi:hypothetical protein